MKNKILISEMAKKYNVSRPTLIYYDNIGLLSPRHDDATGYRYYSLGDMEKLEMILTLKETGLPLKIIKTFMENPSHKESIVLLKNQREIIQKKILEFQKLEILLDKRIHNFEQYEKVKFYEGIQLNYYEAMTFYAEPLNYLENAPLESAAKLLKSKLDRLPVSYGSIISKYGLCLSTDSLYNEDYENYSYVFDYLSDSVDDVKKLTSPSGYYVCSLHQGLITKTGDTIKKIINYIDTHQYSINDNCYIIPLIDSWATSCEDEYVSEILIPVIFN
ncbi:MerR family transcriptional regulator [Fusobacteria bacterium ZRK30]|nr:MerR family transcriptional regulator [Fusobacteria bacterium ZRK30]